MPQKFRKLNASNSKKVINAEKSNRRSSVELIEGELLPSKVENLDIVFGKTG
jgi:hypothetical protein